MPGADLKSGGRYYDTRHRAWCTLLYEIPSRKEKVRPSILIWLDGSPRVERWTEAANLSRTT